MTKHLTLGQRYVLTRLPRQTIYNYIYADRIGEMLANTKHKGEYNHKAKKEYKPQLYAYRLTEILTITTDNDSEFSNS